MNLVTKKCQCGQCLQVNSSVTFFLHDAVYLYLRVLNQTVDEGYTNYTDGRLIRSKAVGQQFEGTCSVIDFFVEI